jgi:hypothetical protein
MFGTLGIRASSPPVLARREPGYACCVTWDTPTRTWCTVPRMRATSRWATVVFTGFLLAGATAGTSSAQTTTCPTEIEAVSTFVPGYGRIGTGLALRLVAQDFTTISNVNVTIDNEAGVTATPVTLTGDSTQVVLPPPTTGDTFNVTFAWDQDAGTQEACHGTDSYRLPLVPEGAIVGKPTSARLRGHFEMRFVPRNYEGRVDRVRWALHPRCEYFGCTTDVRSSSGFRGVLKLRSRNTYRLDKKLGRSQQSCTVTRVTRSAITGEVISSTTTTIPRAFRTRVQHTLHVTREKQGRAIRLAGTSVFYYEPTPVARQKGCTKTYRDIDSLTGRLR